MKFNIFENIKKNATSNRIVNILNQVFYVEEINLRVLEKEIDPLAKQFLLFLLLYLLKNSTTLSSQVIAAKSYYIYCQP